MLLYLAGSDELSWGDGEAGVDGGVSVAGIELKHLCLEYMTPWLLNLVRFCKHNDDAKRQRVTAILDKLITMTINEKQMYPSIQAKIWGSLGQVSGAQGRAEGVKGRGGQALTPWLRLRSRTCWTWCWTASSRPAPRGAWAPSKQRSWRTRPSLWLQATSSWSPAR